MALELGVVLELGMMMRTGMVDNDPFPFLVHTATSSSSQGANRPSLRLRAKLLVLNEHKIHHHLSWPNSWVI